MKVKENSEQVFILSEKKKQFAKKVPANCRMKKNLKQVYSKFALMQMKSLDIKSPPFICKFKNSN